MLWSTLLAGHAAGAAVWWWLMPGGFPSSSREYWMNQVAPFGPFVILALAIAARTRSGERLFPPLLLMFPLFWITLAISARLTFPVSIGSVWMLPFYVSVAIGALWVRQFRHNKPSIVLCILFGIPALLAGWTMPPTQRALDPATAPEGSALPEVASEKVPGLIRVGKDAQIHPADGRIVIRSGELVLTVQPFLSIGDRSLDRFWTSFSAPEDSKPTTRKLTTVAKEGVKEAARWKLAYHDEDASVLDVGLRDGAIDLDARSRLAHPVYTHLDRYAELALRGHKKLSVAFSFAPKQRIDVPPAKGPARFAYVDAAGACHVVEAAKEQRGPFTELASGSPPRGAALGLVLYDGDAPVFRVTLEDFLAQASKQPSPSAGWGVPMNSIELARVGDTADAPVLIGFSLAGTQIGRGSQSVGLSAGTYRNRMTIAIAR